MHQMHGSPDSLSAADRRLSAHCRRLNPDFEYVFWDNDAVDALVRKKIPSDYAWWRAMQPPIKGVDASQYFILCASGGAYHDLDVECISLIETVVRELPPGTA
jgi:mannosyltransferase OCH1-like enzyme